MINVAILAHPQVALFEMACAAELFALPRPEFEDWYQTDIVSFESNAITSLAGLVLQAKTIATLEDYDVLVVPSWPIEGEQGSKVLKSQVKQFAKQGKRILSFCSGAFLLAELGLLQQRRATTHWRYEEAFRSRFPDVDYQNNVLYVFDGVIGCSAGSAAGLDLGLAVIRGDFGYQVANQVAKRLVVSSHRLGGQSQFVEAPILAVPNQFSHAIEWAQRNITRAIQVGQLAEKANMSRRTFDRKFRSSFDLSPKEWLIQQRIERAKGLLESGDTTIEVLASQSGFDNAITMRHHFRRLVGVSPKQYRAQFGVR